MTTIDPALLFFEQHLQKLQVKLIEGERKKTDEVITNLGNVVAALMQGLETLNGALNSMASLVLEAADRNFTYDQRDMLETRIKEHTNQATSLIDGCKELTDPIIKIATKGSEE